MHIRCEICQAVQGQPLESLQHQRRSLLLDSIGEATLNIFNELNDTGTDLDGTTNALRDEFKESQNFRSTKQCKDKTWNSFISKLRAEGEHCNFPAGLLDTEISMTMIQESEKKVVKRPANFS